ncbi:MAG: radical SAM protein [Actinomycetota bacterium]|nr:radical SAM protein [Actinomycetota bacterium]
MSEILEKGKDNSNCYKPGICEQEIKINRPPFRKLRRFFYRNLGPPRMPGSFSLGCYLVERFPERIPFTKYASPNYYTYYIPPFRTRAYKRVVLQGLRRDFHLPSGPAAVTLSLTERCPCSCYHCSAWGRSKGGEMDTQSTKDVIRQCVDMLTGCIVFTGGEPMMREDLCELIEYTTSLDACPQLFTCGYFLDEESVERLARSGLAVLFVSLDSPYGSEHDSGRGVDGLFEKACRGIRLAVRQGISVGISTFATHQFVSGRYAEKFFHLGRQLGVNEITVFDVTPTGKMLRDEELLLTPEEHDHLCQIQEGQYARKDGPKIVTMSYVNDTDIIGCFGAKYQLHITHNGFVTPCDFTPLHFGNVLDEPLRQIWKRMREHPEYSKKLVPCRMQDMSFRKKYIDKIPDDAALPYPIEGQGGHL